MKPESLERQNGFGGLTITHFQKPVIIWLVWWLPGISYSQNLSLFDMTRSYPSMNGLFLEAFVENNQWQFFNIMAVWWNELKEDKKKIKKRAWKEKLESKMFLTGIWETLPCSRDISVGSWNLMLMFRLVCLLRKYWKRVWALPSFIWDSFT